jgi:chromosome partitioning protein
MTDKGLCRVITVANQKGGVGKTTTAVNLAAGLGLAGVKTLLIDFDPQGNATSGFGLEKSTAQTAFDVIVGDLPPEKAIRQTPYGDILPSCLELAGAEIALVETQNREHALKRAITELRAHYNVIIIDCPPSLGLLTLNALCAADSVLIPLQCEYFALEGLSMLVNSIRTVRKKLNPRLDIDGILFTMFDGRTNLAMQVVREVKKYFADKVYKTVIPRNVRLSEAPSHGKPIQFYDKSSKGAAGYIKLTEEFMRRNRISGKKKQV